MKEDGKFDVVGVWGLSLAGNLVEVLVAGGLLVEPLGDDVPCIALRTREEVEVSEFFVRKLLWRDDFYIDLGVLVERIKGEGIVFGCDLVIACKDGFPRCVDRLKPLLFLEFLAKVMREFAPTRPVLGNTTWKIFTQLE